MSVKLCRIALSCVLGCALAVTAVAGEEVTGAEEKGNKVSFAFESIVKDGYLSNGYLYADEWVIQSYGLVSFDGFCFSVWNSAGLEDSHYAGSYASEIDYELDYNWKIGDFDFMAGVASFVYPDTDDAFDDWVAKATIGYNGWWLRPEVNARIGLEGQQGDYSQFILSKVFGLADNLSLRAYGIVAYGTKSYRARHGCDASGLVDAEIGVRLTYSLCSCASVCVGCQYAVLLSDGLRNPVDAGTTYMADGDTEHSKYYAGLDLVF